MRDRDAYRIRAEACLAEAEKATNLDLKRHYADLAGAWLALAGDPDRREPSHKPKKSGGRSGSDK
jgi:hypothetical protein